MHKIILLLTMTLLIGACNSTSTGQSTTANNLKKIEQLEAQLMKAEDVQKDMQAAKQLVQLSEAFYKNNPQHERTPEILLKAGDVARGLGNPGKAIQLWGFLWRDYPDNEKAPDALFLQALTFETMLNDKQNAQRYYNKVLEQYPDHSLAKQALTSLQQIQMTPEELIKQFEKQREE